MKTPLFALASLAAVAFSSLVTSNNFRKSPSSLLAPLAALAFSSLTPIVRCSQQLLAVLAILSGSWDAVLWGGADETRELVSATLGASASSSPAFTASILPGGLSDLKDFLPWRTSSSTPPENFEGQSDVVVCTPTALGPLSANVDSVDLWLGVRTLVVDECDMLLDGGYRRPLDDILMGLRRKEKLSDKWEVEPTQVVWCGATVPNVGLKR